MPNDTEGHPYPRERTWPDCEKEVERLRAALVADDGGNAAYQSGWHARDAVVERLRGALDALQTHFDIKAKLCDEKDAEIERLRGLYAESLAALNSTEDTCLTFAALRQRLAREAARLRAGHQEHQEYVATAMALQNAVAEIARLRDVIDRAAAAWLSLHPGVAFEGDVGGAMAAAVAEIGRLRGLLTVALTASDQITHQVRRIREALVDG